MALPSLPLPPVPGRLTPGPPSFAIDQDLSSTHQALQDTFLKLQSSLLTSLDNQLIKADAETKHHQYAARKGEEELRHVGEELYRAEREVGRLNGGLGQVRTILQHSEADRRVLETDREAAERELAKTQNANKNLSTNLTQIRRRLDDSVTKIGHMGQVNAAYFSSIKIQRRVEEKLKKELEMSEEKRKAAEEDHEEANKRCELLTKEKKGLEDLLDGQRHETSMASSALAKTHSEMRALAYQKRHLEKQWEDAVAAMAKRDKALQAIEGRRSELKEKVVVLEREVGGARRREDEVEQMAKGKELENTTLQNSVSHLKHALDTTTTQTRTLRNDLVEAQVAESLYRQELDRITKHHDLALDELDRKAQTVSSLRSTLATLKSDYEAQTKTEIFTQIAKRTEHIESIAENHIVAVTRDQDAQNVHLRHDTAHLRLDIESLKQQLRETKQERDAIKDRYEHVNTHYNKLYDESKHIIYALERKEHDVNSLKAKIHETKRVDKTHAYQLEFKSMQAELRAAHAENERLQNLWLETQKRKLEGDVSGAKLMDQNAFLNTQLTITDTTRAKTFAEIARHKEDAIEQQLEAAKLDAELRRLRPVVEDLRNKNEALEMQVVEMRAHMDENNVNSSTSTGMLKTEIRRLYSDRSAVRQARMTDERATHSLERKYVLAREMVEKLKAEKYELMKGQWELKARAEEMERRWMEMRVVVGGVRGGRGKGVKGVMEAAAAAAAAEAGSAAASREASKSGGERMTGNGRATSAGSTASAAHRPPWASLASTPRSLMDTRGKQEPPSSQQASRQGSRGTNQSTPVPPLNEVPDIQAWRLKIETLTSERTYLMNENDLLNAQLQGLHQSLATQQSQTQTLQSQLQKLQTQVNNFNSQHEAVRVRMVRAEKVAAHLERQFKEARPNARIEYRMVGDVEPSTQLLACLMPRDLPIPASTT